MPHVIIHDAPSAYDELVAALQVLLAVLKCWL